MRLKRPLILGNAAILAVMLVATLLLAHTSRESHEARARQAAVNLAQTLSQNVSASFKLVDNDLQSTLKRLDDLEAKGLLDARELARIAEEQRILVPAIDALRVTDANGLVLNPGNRPAISVADRDYFMAVKADPTRPVVSEPHRGRIIGGWGLAFARARVAADGHFKGAVYASIKAERFRDEFKRADVGAQGAVTLRSSSLQLIARHSPLDANPESGIGTAKVSEQLRAALAANPARGSFVTRTALDGVERVSAYEAVPGYPMLLLVGLATDDFYAAWRREVGMLVALLLLLEALVAASSVWLYRTQPRQAPTAA